jgi:RNA polymerase sigma-70 factor, ECF subfamily
MCRRTLAAFFAKATSSYARAVVAPEMRRCVATKTDAPGEASQHLLRDLVSRVACGDEAALADFYDLTRRRVFGLALAIVGDRAAAEEAALEAYTQAWQQAAAFDASRGSVWSWLLTMTRTRALDLLRARTRQARRVDALESVGDVAAQCADLGDVAVASERARLVRAALLALPENERQPLLVAYFSGRSYTETAAYLGIPEGTVKTRIRQGLATLRRTLASVVEELG